MLLLIVFTGLWLEKYGTHKEVSEEAHQGLIYSLALDLNAFIRLLIFIGKFIAQSTDTVIFNVLMFYSP